VCGCGVEREGTKSRAELWADKYTKHEVSSVEYHYTYVNNISPQEVEGIAIIHNCNSKPMRSNEWTSNYSVFLFRIKDIDIINDEEIFIPYYAPKYENSSTWVRCNYGGYHCTTFNLNFKENL